MCDNVCYTFLTQKMLVTAIYKLAEGVFSLLCDSALVDCLCIVYVWCILSLTNDNGIKHKYHTAFIIDIK